MKKLLLYCGCLLFFLFSANAQQSSAEAISKIDSFITDQVREKNFSGVVMVSRNGTVLYQKAVGYADAEKKIFNTVSTNFNIASMGKVFTAAMIMQLIQEGKLSLNDPVNRYISDDTITNGKTITVAHLLTHTSGIGNYMMHKNFSVAMKSLRSLKDVMNLVVEMKPTKDAPGGSFDYSNSGFIVLGRIIETITGKEYIANLKERIFTPAGLTNSYIHYPATFHAPKEAVPYYVFSSKTRVNGISDEFPGFSDGGMQSNAIDLTKFAEALLNNRLLAQALCDSMWKEYVDANYGEQYGLGWFINTSAHNRKIVGHSGGGHGFSSDLQISLNDKTVVVVLINNNISAREISKNIFTILYKNYYEKPQKPLENILFEAAEEKGVEFVTTQYQEILKRHHIEKTPNAWVYIRLSDIFSALNRHDDALRILELGRAEFPAEAPLYNVTGNIYMSKNNKQESIKWFSKALEVNPRDEYANMMLNEIKK
ncbi:MAG: serine hydrolase [Bacteroidota bacterium]